MRFVADRPVPWDHNGFISDLGEIHSRGADRSVNVAARAYDDADFSPKRMNGDLGGDAFLSGAFNEPALEKKLKR